MKSSSRLATGAGITAIGLLVAATPRFLFPICEYHGIFMQMMGKTDHMPCFGTARSAYIIGALIGLIGVTVLLSKGPEALRMLAIVLAGASAAVIATPYIFPVCANPDEPCNHGTVPMLIVLGIVGLGMSAWLAYAARKSRANQECAAPSAPDPA